MLARPRTRYIVIRYVPKESRIMSKNRFVPFLVLFAASLVWISCSAKKPASAAGPREAAASPPATSVAPPGTAEPSTVPADVLSADLATLNRKGYLRDAFFDYDRAELREDARTALAGDAQWLRKYPSAKILVEGHCDERGTDEYNLALGDRRANATREYLASLGVPASRIGTVSYGKERPFCAQDTEQCWQENRRGHLLITAK
jgi:peptidoglycan-associated lipoprotein